MKRIIRVKEEGHSGLEKAFIKEMSSRLNLELGVKNAQIMRKQYYQRHGDGNL